MWIGSLPLSNLGLVLQSCDAISSRKYLKGNESTFGACRKWNEGSSHKKYLGRWWQMEYRICVLGRIFWTLSPRNPISRHEKWLIIRFERPLLQSLPSENGYITWCESLSLTKLATSTNLTSRFHLHVKWEVRKRSDNLDILTCLYYYSLASSYQLAEYSLSPISKAFSNAINSSGIATR